MIRIEYICQKQFMWVFLSQHRDLSVFAIYMHLKRKSWSHNYLKSKKNLPFVFVFIRCTGTNTPDTDIHSFFLSVSEWAINYKLGANQTAMILMRSRKLFACTLHSENISNVSLILVIWLQMLRMPFAFQLNDWIIMKAKASTKSNPSNLKCLRRFSGFFLCIASHF